MIRKMFQLIRGLTGFIHKRFRRIGPSCNNTSIPLKQSVMNSQTIQQEVLVFVQTVFVQKILMEHIGNDKKSYPAEQLEKVFWNGMLNQMLAEFIPPDQQRRPEISIWQIRTSDCSLLIDMADAPDIVEDSCSLSPFLFLSTVPMN